MKVLSIIAIALFVVSTQSFAAETAVAPAQPAVNAATHAPTAEAAAKSTAEKPVAKTKKKHKKN
ncbi:MAG: hypothetical protein JST80_04640 [Bdellovibrionales bacterium]|nr:hypothetical protein [Bdellovibrionales bacterium]